MSYTLKILGEQLKKLLSEGYDIKKISDWATGVYFNNIRSLDKSCKELLESLSSMEDDPQFEYSEKELNLLVILIISGDLNPLDQVNNFSRKYSISNDYQEKLDKFLQEAKNKYIAKERQYMQTSDPSVTKTAEILDEKWLMCPDCIDAWESTSQDGMVICPKCNQAFHNSRYFDKI